MWELNCSIAGIIADYPSPVYLFVERYLLWVLLMKDEPADKERLKEDRVLFRFGMKLNDKIYLNLKQSLREIKQDQSFIITTDNSKYCCDLVGRSAAYLIDKFSYTV